ncbi:MAG TPA: hypothetical protein VL485_11860 [Ktedonobacteraceae bacterium]|nr:hypothetical protein [Ktedonobacteraceae bacterium]
MPLSKASSEVIGKSVRATVRLQLVPMPAIISRGAIRMGDH